jgi:hypothetical protein
MTFSGDSSSSRCKSLAFAVALLFAAGTALAEDAPQDSTSTQQNSSAQSSQDGWKRSNGGWANQAGNQLAASWRVSAAPARFPPPLAIPEGTVLTVRINQALSSDHNRVGDVFSATLTQPVVVHGIVVAQNGQTVLGRVVEAKKAGMVSGVSHLGIQLTSLTIADGQNVPLESQLLVQKGPTSRGRDTAAIVGTTALGAAVGAAVDWGAGAAIGAGAGAVASTVGVLLTRGYPTVVYPETLLTFQLTAPVPVNTDYAPEAFHAVTAADYPQTQLLQQAPPPQAGPPPPGYGYPAPSPYYVYGPPPYHYSYPYPFTYPYYYPYYGYYGYPYYWGPGFSFFFGPGYYGHYYGHYYGGYHGGGYHGGHH